MVGGGGCFFLFLSLFQRNLIKFSKYLLLRFAFHNLVLKLSAFKKRRAQGHSQIGQKRVMILKEVKSRHKYTVPEIFKRGSQCGSLEREGWRMKAFNSHHEIYINLRAIGHYTTVILPAVAIALK